jgi:hypothetical protein
LFPENAAAAIFLGVISENFWFSSGANQPKNPLLAALGSMEGFLVSLNPFRFKPIWPARTAPKSL